MKRTRWWMVALAGAVALIWSAGAGAQASGNSRTITESDCTAAKLGDSIAVSAIGEPVSGVTLSVPRWNPPGRNPAAWCSVNGSMAPVDHSATAKPINFQVAFPATWSGRAVQLGGGGMNGTIPMLAGGPLAQGYVTYGSDSGHQMSFGRGPARGEGASDDWALNEEAIRNLGYMQLKKTHDAAMVLVERLYGGKPEYNYFVGSSQGG